MPNHSPLPLFLVALALVASCAANPGSVDGDHTHRVTTTVTVTDQAILPTANVEIPAFSSVVWRNRGSAPLEVAIEATSCGTCETVLGFAPAAHGVRSVAIAPGSVATICFHEVGRFPFVTRIGSDERRGEIVVGGAQ